VSAVADYRLRRRKQDLRTPGKAASLLIANTSVNRKDMNMREPRSSISCRVIAACIGLLVAALALPIWSAPPEKSPGRTRTSRERMLPERLAAAHENVRRYQAARETLSPLPGYADYRAAIHLHVEDSSHTGGTYPEVLREAKQNGVSVIMLSDHYRPPRDFMDSWHSLKDGVLFIPGCEAKGFLLYPTSSIMAVMDGAKETLIERTTQGDGLIFLSHVEERVAHPMDGLTGMEVYNRHYDAMEDIDALLAIGMMMTDATELATLKRLVDTYRDELLAAHLDYPTVYLNKWDKETQIRRLTGVAANDCHHNQVFIVKMIDERTVGIGTTFDRDDELRVVTADKRPGILELTKGHKPGDELGRVDLDTYGNSFRTVSTHILAPELTEPAVRAALRSGHAYVSHDWMCDPTGFRFVATPQGSAAGQPGPAHIMGDEVRYMEGLVLQGAFPVDCAIRLLMNGKPVGEWQGRRFEYAPGGPGVYRVEGWLKVDGEDRSWIYSNPIYLR